MMRLETLFTLLPFLPSCSGSQGDQACGTVPGQSAVPHDVGNFTFPNGVTPTFSAGTSMNISWTTTFSLSTLWLIAGCNFANPTKSLIAGSSATFYVWEVDTDSTNSSQLYSFRVVDATGSSASQRGGGFWSAVFYISGATSPLSSASSSASPSSLLSSTSLTASITTAVSFSSELAATTITNTQTSSGMYQPRSLSYGSRIVS